MHKKGWGDLCIYVIEYLRDLQFAVGILPWRAEGGGRRSKAIVYLRHLGGGECQHFN